MNLADGSKLKTIEDLERYALKNMNRSQMEFKQLAEEEGFTTRERKVGTLVALEIIHAGGDGSPGSPKMATHGLTVLGGDFLLVVVMLNLDGGDAGTSVLWNHMVGSLQVDPSGWTLGRIIKWTAILLGLFALLLFSRRMYVVRRGPRNIWEAPIGSATSSEGWGHEASGSQPGMSAPSPSAQAPGTARTLPSSPARTLPSSPPRTVPPGGARTLPSSPPRTVPPAGARTLPSSPPRTLPSSPPRTMPSSPARGAPAAGAPDAANARSALDEPTARRGGLTSTLPASGQWSPSA